MLASDWFGFDSCTGVRKGLLYRSSSQGDHIFSKTYAARRYASQRAVKLFPVPLQQSEQHPSQHC